MRQIKKALAFFLVLCMLFSTNLSYVSAMEVALPQSQTEFGDADDTENEFVTEETGQIESAEDEDNSDSDENDENKEDDSESGSDETDDEDPENESDVIEDDEDSIDDEFTDSEEDEINEGDEAEVSDIDAPAVYVTNESYTSGYFTYTLDKANKATIKYTGPESVVEIPKTIDGYPVVAIGSQAFADNGFLTSVKIPNSITTIGQSAFINCVGLKEIDIPDSVTEIGSSAFKGCQNLRVDLPRHLETLGNQAFYGCYALTSITIPKSLTSASGGPFENCKNIETIKFESGTTQIATKLFENCDWLEEIVIPNTVTVIKQQAFAECPNLKKVTIPGSVTEIQMSAFLKCTSLTAINIPGSVKTIKNSAFEGCTSLSMVTLSNGLQELNTNSFGKCTALASITIPKSLTDAKYGPFKGCTILNNVEFEPGTTEIAVGLFEGCTGLEEIVIPGTVTVIEDQTFDACPNLKKVTIPGSVTEIGTSAFKECTSLTAINIPGSVKTIKSSAFEGCTSLSMVTLSNGLQELNTNSFGKCTALASITIPKSLTDAKYGPFKGCTILNNVEFEPGTTEIAVGLFEGCTGLKEIVIPGTVTVIEDQTFDACPNLKKVTIPGSVTEIGTSAFKECTSLADINIPDGVKKIGASAFNGCTSLPEIVIPDTVTSIGDSAFNGCTKLSSVTLSNNLTAVSSSTFKGSDISSIIIPEGVTSIGNYAFQNCKSLSEVTLPNGLKTIGMYAFENCDALIKVEIPDSVTSLGTHIFENCEKISDVTLGTGITTIPQYAFNLCPALQKIVLPYGVTTINANAFTQCTGFTEITIPQSTTKINGTVFSYPKNMTIYGVSGSYAETYAKSIGATFMDITVTGVTLEQTKLEMFNGTTQTLSMTVTPPNFVDKVTWKSSDTKIVTVTGNGEITAKKAGTATVTVTVGKYSASCKVTVLDPIASELSVVNLSEDEINDLDKNLLTAERMSATAYNISGQTITATGTVKYVQGCTGYLGYENDKDMDYAGYFLAMKLKMTNADKFTEEGHLTIYYPGKDETEAKKVYSKDDLTIDGTTGYVNVILNVTNNPNITIKIDYDAEESPQCKETIYNLNLSGLTKEARSNSVGGAKEASVYGVESSSPNITMDNSGTNIKVSYDAVAYSSKVELPEKGEKSGNYIALQLNVPAAVKGTKMLKDNGISVEGAGGDCYIEKNEDNVYLIMPVTQDFSKTFTIKWGGGTNPYMYLQTLTVSLSEDCILESLSRNALLPSSIAFNGLNTTMYVGQSQDVSLTLKKKYEQDGIQVYFTSSNTDIILVNRVTGMIKALKEGTATITVTAMDYTGKTLVKTAKITVKALTAPASVKISNIKDTNVIVSWKANTTGQYMEVYAIPYNSAVLSSKKANWKGIIETAIQNAGLNERTLDSFDDVEKENLLNTLAESLGDGIYQAECTKSNQTSLTIKDLQPKTDYVFYVRNVAVTAGSATVFSGVASDKATTKSIIFDSIKVSLLKGDETLISNTDDSAGVFEITQDLLDEMAEAKETFTINYTLLDSDGEDITAGTTFSSPKFNSGNTKIVTLTTKAKTTTAALKVGSQVGDVKVYVSGKDSSGTAWTSDPITIRVVKKPTSLKKKTTTLTIGQSISIKELIATNLTGNVNGMDLSNVDFEAVLEQIEAKGYFAISDTDSSNENIKDTMITAAALVNGKSGKSVDITFSMLDPETSAAVSSAKATITIKDLAAPAISKVTVRDTSATVQFKPSTTVTEIKDGYYYTLNLTDTVTKEVISNLKEGDSGKYTCVFKPDAAKPGTVWTCEIDGLSSNKAYEVVIVAHCNPGGHENAKNSSKKKFTTSKPLLTSGGSIGINYIALDDLRKNINNPGTPIVFKDNEGNNVDIRIDLENNGTYVFMAQVSNLARALESDKLKWTISSGDKKAATIKASSSTFEMQLTTTKIGTFTVTATSTVTKGALATFVVNVIPYQSRDAGKTDPTESASAAREAYLPETEAELLFRIKKGAAA